MGLEIMDHFNFRAKRLPLIISAILINRLKQQHTGILRPDLKRGLQRHTALVLPVHLYG